MWAILPRSKCRIRGDRLPRGVLPDAAPGDVAGIESALERLMADPDLRSRMGAAARERALRDFSMERLSGELMAFYGRILG